MTFPNDAGQFAQSGHEPINGQSRYTGKCRYCAAKIRRADADFPWYDVSGDTGTACAGRGKYVTPGHPVASGAGYDCSCGQCLGGPTEMEWHNDDNVTSWAMD